MDFLVGGIILLAAVLVLAMIRLLITARSENPAGRPEDASDPFVAADVDDEDQMFSPER